MRIISDTDSQQQVTAWKATPSTQLASLFEHWVNDNGERVDPMTESSVNPSGYTDQYSRLTGFDFGLISAEFRSTVKDIVDTKAINPLSDAALTIEMGVSENSFTAFFKTTLNGVERFWSHDNNLYSILQAGSRSLQPRYGISTELRNELFYNWSILPTYQIPGMFNAKVEIPIEDEERKRRDLLRLNTLVRAHKYLVQDDNLNALNNILQAESENPELGIRLTFGANLSDALVSEDIFTFILELDGHYTSNEPHYTHVISGIDDMNFDMTTYLEYVAACPPICPPPQHH